MKWCSWIKHYISTACFSILVNDTLMGFFQSSWGLRQRDSLSNYYFFIFVIEAFSTMIASVMEGSFLFEFSVGEANSGPLIITHLIFADDTLIFFGASHDYIQALRALILCFGAVSGLKTSFAKSGVVLVWMEDILLAHDLSWPLVG